MSVFVELVPFSGGNLTWDILLQGNHRWHNYWNVGISQTRETLSLGTPKGNRSLWGSPNFRPLGLLKLTRAKL